MGDDEKLVHAAAHFMDTLVLKWLLFRRGISRSCSMLVVYIMVTIVQDRDNEKLVHAAAYFMDTPVHRLLLFRRGITKSWFTLLLTLW